MKEFIAETLQVLLPPRMPGRGSDLGGSGRAAAFRCALLALMTLGLLAGIAQAQEPLKVDPNGWVSIPKALAVGGDETGKLRYHLVWRSGGLDLAETLVADDRLFIQAGTGNVGIGTNVPGQKLTVAGNASFSGLLVGNDSLIGNKTDAFLRFNGADLVLNAAESGKLYLGLDQGGDILLGKNVGIGTVAPKAQLDVAGGIIATTLSVTGNVGIGTGAPMGRLQVGGVGGLVVAGANLDPNVKYDLSPLKNSGHLLVGWNRTGGGGEIDLISNRENGSRGGFNFYDYSNDGNLTPLLEISTTGSQLAKDMIGLTMPGSAEIRALRV